MKTKFAVLTLVVLTLVVFSTRIAEAATVFTRLLHLRVQGKTLLGNVAETGNSITKALGTSATVDFTVLSVGRQESGSITVTGAAVGDVCSVGTTTAAGGLAAQYTCYVSAADTVKIVFAPLSHQGGLLTLGGESPAVKTATVTTGSECSCGINGTTAALAAAGCAASVTGTTLTVTSANASTAVVQYRCTAPVDPASGTFYVRTFSAQ